MHQSARFWESISMELSSSHQLQKNNICLLCGSAILFSDQALLSFECVTGVPKLATVESLFVTISNFRFPRVISHAFILCLNQTSNDNILLILRELSYLLVPQMHFVPTSDRVSDQKFRIAWQWKPYFRDQ